MTKEEFVNYHRNHHAPLFMSHPEVGKYVKKYVVSHPVEIAGFPAPEFDGITDIYFSSLDDYNTLLPMSITNSTFNQTSRSFSNRLRY